MLFVILEIIIFYKLKTLLEAIGKYKIFNLFFSTFWTKKRQGYDKVIGVLKSNVAINVAINVTFPKPTQPIRSTKLNH